MAFLQAHEVLEIVHADGEGQLALSATDSKGLKVVDGADKTFPGVECSGGGNTLEELNLQRGYYRFTPSSSTGYFCTFPQNCVGGNGTGRLLCYEGAGGPLW